MKLPEFRACNPYRDRHVWPLGDIEATESADGEWVMSQYVTALPLAGIRCQCGALVYGGS